MGQTGDLCDLCARQQTPAELLPDGFFTSDRMRAALAGYDFDVVFRSVRRATGFSQQRFGELVELPQERISLIERRTHRLRDIRIIVRVATQLGIPAELLGFASGAATVGVSEPSDGQEVDWMLRRDFIPVVAGITMGLGGVAVGRSVELLATPAPVAAGSWEAHVVPAEVAARQGHAYFTLAAASGNARQAARAVPLLEEAVQKYGSAYARSRAVNLPGLSGSHVIAGNLDAAVYVGGQAVTEITALSSRRALERLRTLDTVLQPHAAEAGVAELREQIRGALTAA